MKLKIVGSGSTGNMYLLTSSSGQVLIVDIGFKMPTVKKALNFNIGNVSILCSHLHGDHSLGARDAMKAGLLVYASQQVHDHLGTTNERRAKILTSYDPYRIGEFTVMAFDVLHDVPTQGFLINHEECGTICYITDTSYIPDEFQGVNHWMIEANYCSDILVDKVFDQSTPTFLAQRVIYNHLSVQDCQRMLINQNLSTCENIILLHLSNSNSDAIKFKRLLTEQTGKQVYIAEGNLEIDLTLEPF